MLLFKFPRYDHKQHIKESIMHCLSEIEILDINSSTHICKIDTHQSWSKAPIFAFGTNFEEALNESLILEKLNLKCNHFRNNIKLGLKLEWCREVNCKMPLLVSFNTGCGSNKNCNTALYQQFYFQFTKSVITRISRRWIL